MTIWELIFGVVNSAFNTISAGIFLVIMIIVIDALLFNKNSRDK